MRVIGIGETVLDILFKDDQPQKAVPGGSTFNSIISLGRAGVPCAMVTEAGGDHIGDITCRYLEDNGVSAEYVCRHEGVKSHVSLAFLDENNDARYIFYKDHASVSMDGRLPRVLPLAEENMGLADVVRGSTEDFGNLYGLQDGDAIYGRVSPFCRTFILTDGARPIRVYTPEGCETFPVPSIETVSTVGAGDNFNAGYIYATLRGLPDQASRIAMASRWSQDACRQIGNSISPGFVASLK